MSKKEIEVFAENRRLKKDFEKLNLDLEPVFNFTPYDLDLENRRLSYLLNFVEKYIESGKSQKTMELIDLPFPPIHPGISPESDWFRFNLWLEGKAVRKKLKNQIEGFATFKEPNQLKLEEAESELKRLQASVQKVGFSFSLNNGIPAQVVYEYIWETLEEFFELDEGGGWSLDGCSGYCPGCFQRPWCDSGLEMSWPEDKKIGKMDLPDILKPYVSASPQSLEILKSFDDDADEEEDTLYRDQSYLHLPPGMKNGEDGFFTSNEN